MNHQKHYNALVAKAQKRSRPEGYVERHHVVPRSLGGGDERENLVTLTAREHYIAHILLAYIHGGAQWYAVQRLANRKRKDFNSRLYQALRHNLRPSAEHKAAISEAMRGNTYNLGKTASDETKAKMSEAHAGARHHYFGKTRSAETRAKIGAKLAEYKGEKHHHFGKTRSAETRAKISQKLAGAPRKPHSAETKARISAGLRAFRAAKKTTRTPTSKD